MTDEEVQALQNELGTTKTQLETEQQARAETEALVATKDNYIATLERVAAERVEELSAKDFRITDLDIAVAERDTRLTTLNQSLQDAILAYKTAVIKAFPSIPEELISGDSIEAINLSLEHATTIVGKVRETIKAEIASASIPAGAPARTAPDLESLSSREKIQYAITKGGKA